jgi:hypothetical protein
MKAWRAGMRAGGSPGASFRFKNHVAPAQAGAYDVAPHKLTPIENDRRDRLQPALERRGVFQQPRLGLPRVLRRAPLRQLRHRRSAHKRVGGAL